MALGVGLLVAGAGDVPALADVRSAQAEADFVRSIDRERTSRGLASLSEKPELDARAREHSQTMASQGRLSHEGSPADDDATAAGENIGSGPSVAVVHQELMRSARHRAEILGPAYTEVGVGVAWSGDTLWVTEIFRQPGAPRPSPGPAPSPRPPPPPPPPPRLAPGAGARPSPPPSEPSRARTPTTGARQEPVRGGREPGGTGPEGTGPGGVAGPGRALPGEERAAAAAGGAGAAGGTVGPGGLQARSPTSGAPSLSLALAPSPPLQAVLAASRARPSRSQPALALGAAMLLSGARRRAARRGGGAAGRGLPAVGGGVGGSRRGRSSLAP